MSEPIVMIVTQLGSLGILAALLLWQGPRAMKVWREQQKENAKLREAESMDRAVTVQRLLDSFREDAAEQRTHASAEMRYEREQCQRQFELTIEETEKSRAATLAALDKQSAENDRRHQEVMRLLMDRRSQQ